LFSEYRYLAAQAELDRLMEVLRKKQAELLEVERQIALLQKIYEKTLAEKRELEETMELTAARLHRAGQLTSALASEQARWIESIKVLTLIRMILGLNFSQYKCATFLDYRNSEKISLT